jgi:hypothetical protein
VVYLIFPHFKAGHHSGALKNLLNSFKVLMDFYWWVQKWGSPISQAEYQAHPSDHKADFVSA